MLAKVFLILLQALGTVATWTAYQEYLHGLSEHNKPQVQHGRRPETTFKPMKPWRSHGKSKGREKICVVGSHDDFVTDDSDFIVDALEECNDGGVVVFPRGRTYVVGKAMDLYLKSVDLGMLFISPVTVNRIR